MQFVLWSDFFAHLGHLLTQICIIVPRNCCAILRINYSTLVCDVLTAVLSCSEMCTLEIACSCFVSSPEHRVLVVSYCGRWMSVVIERRRPSTFIN